MVANVALRRIHNILDLSVPNMKEKARNEHLNGIFKLIDEKYKKSHMVEEDELKRILGNGGFTVNN